MLTTNCDGLWILQVLCGIEVIAPELSLRPHLPSVETASAATRHPMTEDLRSAGVLTSEGTVDDPVREWLTVLSRRDGALLLDVRTPGLDCLPRQALLARYDRWWVTLERSGDVIRISDAGVAPSEAVAGRIISAEVDRLCGHLAPADIRPVTIDAEELLAGIGEGKPLTRCLSRQGLERNQVNVLNAAGDRTQSVQASLVVIAGGASTQIGPGGASTQIGPGGASTQIGPSVVTIIDTPQGRLLCEHTTREGRRWMVFQPGSPGAVASAAMKMLRRIPAPTELFAHRKAV